MLFPRITNTPDRFSPIVAHEQRAIVAHGHAHRTSPDFAFGRNKAGKEVFVFAGGFALGERHTDYLIARTLFAVPGAVLGCKYVAAVFSRKLLGLIKS